MRLIESLILNTCGTCKRKYAVVVAMRKDRTSWEHNAGPGADDICHTC